MGLRFGFCVVVVLNVLMGLMGWNLICSRRNERDATRKLQLGISKLRQDLAVEQSHSDDRDYALKNLASVMQDIRSILESPPEDGTTSEAPGDLRPQADTERISWLLSHLSRLATQPDIEQIERLADDEMKELKEQWRNLPLDVRRASIALEAGAEVETVLADPIWNPTARELSMEERIELAVRLRDLKFFATTLPLQTLQTIVLPEADRKRESRDYVEYTGSPPRLPPGIKISHGEATTVEGVSRMFYFDPDEFNELYRRQRISSEQTLKGKIGVYTLINYGDGDTHGTALLSHESPLRD